MRIEVVGGTWYFEDEVKELNMEPRGLFEQLSTRTVSLKEKLFPVQKIDTPAGVLKLSTLGKHKVSLTIGNTKLESFLNRPYKVVASDKNQCDPEEKNVYLKLKKENLEDPSFVFIALHEVGHSKTTVESEMQRAKELVAAIRELPSEDASGERYIHFKSEVTALEEKGERLSWLSAINDLKVLRNQGFDLRKNYTDFQQFLQVIAKSYSSYRGWIKHVADQYIYASDEQSEGFEEYVDNLFDAGWNEIVQAATEFWENDPVV